MKRALSIVIAATAMSSLLAACICLSLEDFERSLDTQGRETAGSFPISPTSHGVIPVTLTDSSHVFICVFDINGAVVDTAINEQRGPGTHDIRWNMTDSKGDTAETGVYFYKIVTDVDTTTSKMMIVR